MLFIIGRAFGRCAESRPWLAMMLIGCGRSRSRFEVRTMRSLQTIVLALGLFSLRSLAQTNAPGAASPPNSAASVAKLEQEHKWTFSASVYTYIVPDSREYVQPSLTADHDWLHLQGRYNYEALNTGSAWLGYNFSGGEKLTWEFTPMLGGVFGKMNGIAPGYEGSLSWWKLQLYSEGEFVVDVGETSESFFYNWSELTLSPWDWFRFGMVTQRTRLYRTDRDVQRGVLAGFSFKHFDFTTYVLNPDESRPTLVFAAGVHF